MCCVFATESTLADGGTCNGSCAGARSESIYGTFCTNFGYVRNIKSTRVGGWWGVSFDKDQLNSYVSACELVRVFVIDRESESGGDKLQQLFVTGTISFFSLTGIPFTSYRFTSGSQVALLRWEGQSRGVLMRTWVTGPAHFTKGLLQTPLCSLNVHSHGCYLHVYISAILF